MSDYYNPCNDVGYHSVHGPSFFGFSTPHIDPFYSCLKYKIPADLNLDGTDYFIVAESMHSMNAQFYSNRESFDCSLSFTCENDKKAFYKIMKECLQFRIHKESFLLFL